MADPQAHYFHATLYRFSEEARREIIRRFNAALDGVAASCWYDAEKDLFELICPGIAGPQADETLAGVIGEYMAEELRLAERDERVPNILRFAESSFDDAMALPDQLTTQDGPESALAPRKTPVPAITLHLITAAGASMKLFELHELPEGMLERVLGDAADQRTNKLLSTGLTCRSVRQDTRGKGLFVFNGRIGQPLPAISTSEELALLEKAPFHNVIGKATVQTEPEVRHWRFKQGHNVSVNQWIAGMGQTEQYNPDEKPDVPKDAKKMLAVDQNPALGRVRVPKGASVLPAEMDDEESMAGDKLDAKDFASLIRGRRAGDSDSEGSDAASAASQESDTTVAATKKGFGSLFRKDPMENKQPATKRPSPQPLRHFLKDLPESQTTPRQAPQSFAQAVRPSPQPAHIPPADGPLAGHLVTSGSGAISETLPSASGYFPSYGREFAVVDNIGITANAASQAQWDLNHPRTPKKSTKSGIQLAAQASQILSPRPTPSGSATMSLTTPLNPLPTPQSMSAASMAQATAHKQGSREPADPDWVNRIVQDQPATGKLVDVSAPASTAKPLQRPPGLGPPLDSREEAERDNRRSRARVFAARANGSLIDVEQSTLRATPPVRRSPGLTAKPLRPATITPEPGRAIAYTEDLDEIVERLQPSEDVAVPKKFTMRQKAQKKGKAKGGTISKSSGKKVELPKPDPVPPPKKQVKGKAPAAVATNVSENGTDRPSESISPQAKELQCLLAVSRAQYPEISIEIQLGLVLISHPDKLLRRFAFPALQLNPPSIQSADMLRRLTTSTGDAKYLLDLGEKTSPIDGEASYEFLIRDGHGNLRSIDCGSDAQLSSSGLSQSSVIGMAYMHYPHHVWDARYVLKGPAEELDEGMKHAAQQLLSSLTTADEAPSFYAKQPKDAFTVEKVYAKRTYTRRIDEGMKLVVTEFQDLLLQTLNEPSANLKAVCLTREGMVEAGKLWWEAKIDVEGGQVSGGSGGKQFEGDGHVEVQIEKLQKVVDRFVSEMDGVGYGNRGPWERREGEEREENAVPGVPFW